MSLSPSIHPSGVGFEAQNGKCTEQRCSPFKRLLVTSTAGLDPADHRHRPCRRELQSSALDALGARHSASYGQLCPSCKMVGFESASFCQLELAFCQVGCQSAIIHWLPLHSRVKRGRVVHLRGSCFSQPCSSGNLESSVQTASPGWLFQMWDRHSPRAEPRYISMQFHKSGLTRGPGRVCVMQCECIKVKPQLVEHCLCETGRPLVFGF